MQYHAGNSECNSPPSPRRRDTLRGSKTLANILRCEISGRRLEVAP